MITNGNGHIPPPGRNASLMNIFAPFFYILCASLRCFLETRVYSVHDAFSYYTLLHHVLWYLTSILGVLLFLSFYLKRSPRELSWLFYGGVIVFIPPLHAWITKTPMDLEYFTGSAGEIILYSITAAWQFTRNRPQFFAIILLDVGIFLTGYYYTRSWRRALVTLVGTHGILTLIGTKWFGKYDLSETLILVRTDFPGHAFMALIWLQTASILTLFLVRREVSLKGGGVNQWGKAIVWGGTAWALCAVSIATLGTFRHFFDAATTMCMVWVPVIFGYMGIKRKACRPTFWVVVILAAVLGFQMVTTIPLFFEGHLSLTPKKIVVPF